MRTMFAWKVAMTTFEKIGVLYEVLKVSEIPLDYSSIAQLIEHAAVNCAVVGSSPTRGVFNERIKIRLRGQAVKTSPFHGGNTGSIPVGVIKNINKVLTDLYSWYIVRQ